MALKPGSEQGDPALPDDYKMDHPEESPEQWGWHGEFGRWARISGWIVAVVLVLMITTTHYNNQGDLFLDIFAGGLILALLYDRHNRKNSWRS